MSIYVGIDGGGTSTRMFLQTDEETPVLFAKDLSIKVAGRSFSDSAERLRALLIDATGGDLSDIRAIAVGLSGMSRVEDQDELRNALKALPALEHVAIHIEGDASLALRATVPEETEGILLIAGTGSVLFARCEDGETRRIGGWGPVLSDEGSGYWIGLAALRYHTQVFDGRAERDPLYDRLKSILPRGTSASPVALAQHLERHPRYPAELAKHVFEVAFESDQATKILDAAAVCLSAMVKQAEEWLSEERTHPVVLAGSIAKHPMIVEQLSRMLYGLSLDLRLMDDLDVLRTALHLARELDRNADL